MKTMLAICSCLSLTASATAFGHGIPIAVGVDASNKLIVSNPQPLYTPRRSYHRLCADDSGRQRGRGRHGPHHRQ